MLWLLPLGWFMYRLEDCSQCDAAVGHEQLQRWQQEAELLVCWQAVYCKAPCCKGCQIPLGSADAAMSSVSRRHQADTRILSPAPSMSSALQGCSTVAPACQTHTTERQWQQCRGHSGQALRQVPVPGVCPVLRAATI